MRRMLGVSLADNIFNIALCLMYSVGRVDEVQPSWAVYEKLAFVQSCTFFYGGPLIGCDLLLLVHGATLSQDYTCSMELSGQDWLLFMYKIWLINTMYPAFL